MQPGLKYCWSFFRFGHVYIQIIVSGRRGCGSMVGTSAYRYTIHIKSVVIYKYQSIVSLIYHSRTIGEGTSV